MVLTSNDRKELHQAILEYLSVAFPDLSPDLKTALEKEPTSSPSDTAINDTVLEKRWNTLRRLTLLNTQLEQKVKELESKVATMSDPLVQKQHHGEAASSLLRLPSGPEPLHRFRGHRDAVTAVALHPHDPLLFSASLDATVRIFDFSTKRQKQQFAHADSVTALAVEPLQGECFVCVHSAAGDAGSCISLYESDARGEYALSRTLRAGGGEDSLVVGVAWCGDACKSLVSCSRDGTICAWQPSRGSMSLVKKQRCFESRRVMCICASPSGHVAVGCSDGSIFFTPSSSSSSWISDDDAPAMTQLTTAAAGAALHSNAVTGLTFLSNESDSILIAKHGSAERRAARRNTRVVDHSPATAPQFLVSCARDKNVILTDLVAGAIIWQFQGHDGWVTGLSLLPSPAHIVSVSDDDTMRVLGLLEEGKEERRIGNVQQDGGVMCVGGSAGSRELICCGGPDKTVSLWGFK